MKIIEHPIELNDTTSGLKNLDRHVQGPGRRQASLVSSVTASGWFILGFTAGVVVTNLISLGIQLYFLTTDGHR